MSMDWFSRSDEDKTTPGIWWVCVPLYLVSVLVWTHVVSILGRIYRNTHCAACRCMHYLRWSRCAVAPQSGVCLCRRRPQGPCRRAAICTDSPSHRRARSRSEETGEALYLWFVFIYLSTLTFYFFVSFILLWLYLFNIFFLMSFGLLVDLFDRTAE